MKTNHRIKNDKSWKEQLKEVRKEFRTVTRPCLAMSTERFNKLMREYKIIKPQWPYHKRKKYLQFIIDQSHKKQEISRNIKPEQVFVGSELGYSLGAHHAIRWLDEEFDKLLDNMIQRDVL